MKDITVILKDQPGTLADVAEALGKANVNIEGGCGFPCENRGILHILVRDPESAKKALKGADFEFTNERDVLVMDVDDKPGELGRICRKISDAGVNLDLFYLATNTRLVLGVDDLEKASSVF
ncbi:MAG: ACT domain-containing protein [Candidatus Hodarchaeales archaeon]|jgi:hypothetical protein